MSFETVDLQPEMVVEQIELLPLKINLNHSFIEPELTDSVQQQIREIPNQMAFKIGTAAEIVGVKTHVLRFWEKEFESLRPKKSTRGQRMYTRREIESAILIKKLLYEDRFSIEGARSHLRALRNRLRENREREATMQDDTIDSRPPKTVVLDQIKSDLSSILLEIESFRTRFAQGLS